MALALYDMVTLITLVAANNISYARGLLERHQTLYLSLGITTTVSARITANANIVGVFIALSFFAACY